jgi:hypothetical protein
MRRFRTSVALAALMITAPAMAGGMTCRDYADSAKAFAYCRTNTDRAGLMNCCAGAVAWKVACDLYHVHAESHAAASALAYSTAKGRRAGEVNMKICSGKAK